MNTPPLHPDAVGFDAMECCALERACAQEIHLPFVHNYLAATGEVHPIYKAAVMLGIFKHSFRLEFIPHEIHRVVYAHVAAAEREILKQSNDALLECGHTAEQHCEALARVWAKIKPSQECN